MISYEFPNDFLIIQWVVCAINTGLVAFGVNTAPVAYDTNTGLVACGITRGLVAGGNKYNFNHGAQNQSMAPIGLQ